jgi:small subunit ribosomal protein S20
LFLYLTLFIGILSIGIQNPAGLSGLNNTGLFRKEQINVANHKSALKRAKQNAIRRLRNKTVRTRVRNVVKDVQLTAGEQSGEKVSVSLNQAKSVIDIAAKKGVIHRKTAARKISRLSKLANTATAK